MEVEKELDNMDLDRARVDSTIGQGSLLYEPV